MSREIIFLLIGGPFMGWTLRPFEIIEDSDDDEDPDPSAPIPEITHHNLFPQPLTPPAAQRRPDRRLANSGAHRRAIYRPNTFRTPTRAASRRHG
ncbi:hypothetical protein H6758_01540 [Candidatus Nomurabacteria bacterium]|nr:hypothetical protein [Candidatus Nomurabacteria bacterium]